MVFGECSYVLICGQMWESSLWLFKLISQKLKPWYSHQRQWDVKWNTRREISYLQAAMYYFVYHINGTNYKVLPNFLKISNIFFKFFKYCPKVTGVFRIIFQRFPRKIWICFAIKDQYILAHLTFNKVNMVKLTWRLICSLFTVKIKLISSRVEVWFFLWLEKFMYFTEVYIYNK